MLPILRKFFKGEYGQDLAEYCLLTALIALIGLGIFWRVSGGMQGMWGQANTTLATGNSGQTAAPAVTHDHHRENGSGENGN